MTRSTSSPDWQARAMSFWSLSACRTTSDFTLSHAAPTSLAKRSLSSSRSSWRSVKPSPAVDRAVKKPKARTSWGAKRIQRPSSRGSAYATRCSKIEAAGPERHREIGHVAALDSDVAYEPDAQRAAQDAWERFGSRRLAHQINPAQRIVG